MVSQQPNDMQDMRDCYDSLLSAAAATANSAYEFSESLRELGACLLEKTALNNDDEESGRVLLMLGKIQFELQKLVDSYRSHIFQTVTIPSESLLNELRTVEEMKRQCDEKRDVYDYMMTRQREKGRSKTGKGESFSLQQLQMARDEYDEESTLLVFRLKSLKQGQTRSLLTQAARHHAAQLCFFKKAVKSLEALDQVDITFPQVANMEAVKENMGRFRRNSFSYRGISRPSSQSAPLFAEYKFDSTEKARQMQPSSTRKLHTYVLPTPVDTRSSISTGSGNPVLHKTQTTVTERTQQLWHSSPLEPNKLQKIKVDEKVSGPTVRNAQSVLKESNNNSASTRLPPPLADGLLFSWHDTRAAAEPKKLKRYAFSGPLTSKPWPTKPVSADRRHLYSGPLLRNPMSQPPSTSPTASPSTSPTFMSSPKISELHELPRPPASSTPKSSRPKDFTGHSAPLGSRDQVLSTTNKSVVSNAASPLPTPPQTVARSFSIPSSSPEAMNSNASKPLETPHSSEMTEVITSPPLTPITLSSN
ncbi:uncharacterized protein CFP56_024298 [Quercus suber]|uniref:BAR domain-containing protein n=1 Tax=Quercus suber TaxID=58331 RepID=A0AAW0MGF2_QUESU